jgi:dipeptidyl-peptidase-3
MQRTAVLVNLANDGVSLLRSVEQKQEGFMGLMRGLLVGALLAMASGCQKAADEQEIPQPPKALAPSHEKEVEAEKVASKQLEGTARIVDRADGDFQAGAVGDVKLIRIFADEFAGLTPTKRLLAYHLSRAILLGRDIAYDQVHPGGLEVRRLVEAILHQNIDLKPDFEAKVLNYLQLLTIHSGFYDHSTFRKFLPPFTAEQFEQAAKVAYAAGADLGLMAGEPLMAKLSRLRKIIFDAEHEPVRGGIISAQEDELLLASNTNLYEGVTVRMLARFKENYPSNSRLVRVDDALVEEIYRTGDNRLQIPPGRYSRELTRVIGRLQNAITIASSQERKILSQLVEYFRTGDQKAFDEAIHAWSEAPLPMEFAIGFLDVRLDPRKLKGIFSGFLGYEDRLGTAKLASLLRHTKAFEERMPWGTEYMRAGTNELVAVAAHVLTVAGRQWPLCDFSFEIWPRDNRNAGIRRKVVVATNVIEAYSRVAIQPLLKEFVEPAVQAKTVVKAQELFFWRVVLRDVLGQYMGRITPSLLVRLRNLLDPIEALKAELVALWLLSDPTMVDMGFLTSRESGLVGSNMIIAEALVSEAANRTELREPSALALRLLLRYLVENAKVVALEEQNKKLYPLIKNPEAFHAAVGKLLVRVQRVLAAGKRQSALKLLAEFSDPPTWAGLEGVAERAKAIGLRRLAAYVTPRIIPIRDANNKVTDATLSQNETFERKIIRYSRQHF